MKRKSNLDELRWVRLFASSHIPRYLVEQIAKRDYEIDDLYTYLEANLLVIEVEGTDYTPHPLDLPVPPTYYSETASAPA